MSEMLSARELAADVLALERRVHDALQEEMVPAEHIGTVRELILALQKARHFLISPSAARSVHG